MVVLWLTQWDKKINYRAQVTALLLVALPNTEFADAPLLQVGQ